MPKRNGFFMFMMERRPQIEAGGNKLENGWAQLSKLVSAEWQAMSPEAREVYTERAKKYNERRTEGEKQYEEQFHVPQKPVDQLMATREQKMQTLNEIRESNRDIVIEMFKDDKWKTQPIVVCSFALYLDPDLDELYIPAEIGLVTFSLEKGITDSYGRVMDPGRDKIPSGRGIEAFLKVENLGIPDFGVSKEFGDFNLLLQTLESYLKINREGLPEENFYVFALDSDFACVMSCFEWLANNTGYEMPIKVLSLSLWAQLASTHAYPELRSVKTLRVDSKKMGSMSVFKNGVIDDSQLSSLSNRIFGKPLHGCFTYSPNIPYAKFGIFLREDDVDNMIKEFDNHRYYEELCCVYHYRKGVGTQYCALLTSTRYVYGILEVITISNEVSITPGAHFPETDTPKKEWARRYKLLKPWGITEFEEDLEEPPERVAVVTGPNNRPRGGKMNGGERRPRREQNGSVGDHPRRIASRRSQERASRMMTEGQENGEDGEEGEGMEEEGDQFGGRGDFYGFGIRHPYQGSAPSVYRE